MSTGKIQVRISPMKIDISSLLTELSQPEHGAHLLFLGVVRNHNLGRRVLAVDYDAYPPLTETLFHDLCREAQQKWGSDLNLILIHRMGKLEIGETSVAIGVSSPHRSECYEASRYLIEQLKIRAPIWKKEYYEDGESQWLQGHSLCGHSEP